MCGRFVLKSSAPLIAQEFHAREPLFNIKQSYNIAPSQNVYIVVNDGENKVKQCRWGFIPFWSKDQSVGYKMINARAETITTKRSFCSAFRKNRCIIAADGFYEWRIKGKKRSPFFIRLKSGKPLGLAGIFNQWKSPEGEKLCTCTIVTTVANELIQEIHHRMPVIIPKERQELWLDPEVQDEREVLPLLRPYPFKKMEMYEVSLQVNSPVNNSPENIRPL
ncbi:SOS response-associated peptidase [bacterium]|nr:MAG: SOS response-associated peptidase [bacterium]